MNFFEGQKRARQKTSRLIVLFALAVVGTTLAIYSAFVLVFVFLPHMNEYQEQRLSFWDAARRMPEDLQWIVLGGTSGFILLMSFLRLGLLRAGGGTAVAELFNVRRLVSDTQNVKEKTLFNVVEEMSIASGTPMPPVYLLQEEEGINAFAAGYAPGDSVLAFSKGCLEHLNRDELQGVVAHEMSHVYHGDSRLNIQIAGWLYGILCISDMGRMMMSSRRSYRSRSDSKGNTQIALLGLLLFVCGLVGYFFGRLIQAAISRQREFLADASAVQYTRNPIGIAGALRKIRDLDAGSQIQASAAGGVSHFFFANAFSGSMEFFHTHPPIDERIRAVMPAMLQENRYEPSQKLPPSRSTEANTKSRDDFHAWNAALMPVMLEKARALIEAIPEGVHSRLTDSKRIVSIPVILFISSGVEFWKKHAEPLGVMSDLRAAGVQDSWADILAMAESISGFTQTWRLKLVEIAAPALAENIHITHLLEVSETLVLADGKVSLFELMLYAAMWHFSVRGDSEKAYRAEIRKLVVLRSEVEMLKSILRLCGDSQDVWAHLARNNIDLKRFGVSLDRLSRLSPMAKQKLIAELRATCMEDGQLSDSAEAAMRALNLALDCPEVLEKA